MRKSLCSKCRKIVPQGEGCDKSYCLRVRRSGYKDTQTTSDPWYHLSRKQANKIGFSTNWKGNPNKPIGQRGGLREAQLMREPCCEVCKEQGVLNDVTSSGSGHVDHIIPFRTGDTLQEQMRLFESASNHRTLCVTHHMSKTGRRQ